MFCILRSEKSSAPNGMSSVSMPSFRTGMWDPIRRYLYLAHHRSIKGGKSSHKSVDRPKRIICGHNVVRTRWDFLIALSSEENMIKVLPSSFTNHLWNLTNVKNVNEEGRFVLGTFIHRRCGIGKHLLASVFVAKPSYDRIGTIFMCVTTSFSFNPFHHSVTIDPWHIHSIYRERH